MSNAYNVYCDESCHLENDGQKSMVLGAVWVNKSQVKEITKEIKAIKATHSIKPHAEIKWTGVSPSQKDYYLDLITYFFNNKNLHYRGLVIPDKRKLNHKMFDQTHDQFYYKMYFTLLKTIWRKDHTYRVYIDLKDTNGAKKVEKLEEILRNNSYDFDHKMIQSIQQIHSHESAIMQLTDLLSGAIAYINRGLSGSKAKSELVELIKHRSGYSLTKTTYLTELRFNLLVWEPEGCVD